MWLVVGGPLLVVVASFITVYLAIRTPDPVYTERPQPRVQTQRSADGAGQATLTPAMQARNHAATGGVAKPVDAPAPAAATAAQ